MIVSQIYASIVVPLPRNEVYPIFLDAERMSTYGFFFLHHLLPAQRNQQRFCLETTLLLSFYSITGTECSIRDAEDSDFALFDKFIKGKIKHLVTNHVVELSWRGFDWPIKHFSEVRFQFFEVDAGLHTLVQVRKWGKEERTLM